MPLSTEDRFAIHDLYARFNHAADTGDSETYLSFLTDDIHYKTHLRDIHGKHAMREYVTQRSDGLATAPVRDEQHWNSNIVLDGEGDLVKGRAFMVGIGRDAETGAVRFNFLGHYHDTIVRVDGRWRFKERWFEEQMRHFPES